MRKMLSVFLCVAMFVSILSIGASAVDGTAINSAADFAAMAADGKYYLNADIKIDATYVTPFKGTFDGNGHTITVTKPMFAEFDGTVKNLTINGTEISGAEDLAAFAIFTVDGMTAINVVNNVDITITGLSADKVTGRHAGGILANADVASMSRFISCVNNGDITVQPAEIENTSTGLHYETEAGGIVGRADGLDAKYCVNNGKITAQSNNTRAGGIVGFAVYFASLSTCDITDCTNTAEVFSNFDSGGMAGMIGVASNNIYMPYTITYCVNTGDITGANMVGGFVGYAYTAAAALTMTINITSSVSICNVKGGRAATNAAGTAQFSYVSPFIGYTNSVNNIISDCLFVGELIALTGTDFAAPWRNIHGCSSAKTADEQHHDNYICDNGTIEWYTYPSNATTYPDQVIAIDKAISDGKVTRCTLTELQNGTILGKLNAAANTPVFSQKSGTDLYPTIDLTLRDQRAAADIKAAEETTVAATTTTPVTTAPKETTAKPVTTTAPKETTAKPADTTAAAPVTTAGTPEKGGCGSVFAGGIALIAILGGAVVLGKKRKV